MSNLNILAKNIAVLETGKKQVSIAQIKEIIKLMSVEMYRNPELIAKLISNGKRNNSKVLPELPKFLKK